MKPKGEDGMIFMEDVEEIGVIFMAIKNAMVLKEGESNWEIERDDIILIIFWDSVGRKQILGEILNRFLIFLITIDNPLDFMPFINHLWQFIFAINDIIVRADVGHNLHHITAPDQMVGRGSSGSLEFFTVFPNTLNAEVGKSGYVIVGQKKKARDLSGTSQNIKTGKRVGEDILFQEFIVGVFFWWWRRIANHV